jgi:hypothetical protein
MSEDEESETEEPAVELGEHEPVEGAPVARIVSRLTWPQTKSDIVEQEGESVIRTPDGPQVLEEILDSVDTTYFDTRQTFREAVEDVIGTGPIPTAGDTGSDATEE